MVVRIAPVRGGYEQSSVVILFCGVESRCANSKYGAGFQCLEVLVQTKPELKSCNPGSMKYVNDKDAPQLIAEKNEVVFSYDVLFRVRAERAAHPFRIPTPQSWF